MTSGGTALSDWTAVVDAAPADTDPATAALVSDILDTAAAWDAGELPTPEALAFVLAEPRAIGTAFRAITPADPRWAALERLHALEYGNRYRMVYTTFGWLPQVVWEQVERHMHGPDIDGLRYRSKQ